MKTNDTWHQHSNSRPPHGAYRFRRYTTPACKGCRARHLCRGKTNGRYIDRSGYVGFIQQDARRVEAGPGYYRLRQQVTEHPFGTLKRQRGFAHALVRKKDHVLGEVGLMFIGYNPVCLYSRCGKIQQTPEV
jgi:hypothetical protein